MNTRTWTGFGLALCALTFGALDARAADVVRDGRLIASVKIQGVSLDMTPKDAFEYLFAKGFKAGNIERFSDWDTAGIEFVRGEYGSPSGHSSVVMQRAGDRIVHLAETYNAPGNPIDAEGAIGELRRHFGIDADERKCTTTRPHVGLCEVQDAAEDPDVNQVYAIQILTTMRLVHATRTRELGAATR